MEVKSRYLSILESGALISLELFNVNNTYIEVENKNLWLIDGGIQLSFPAGIIQIGWNADRQMVLGGFEDLKEQLSDLPFKTLSKGNIYRLHSLAGKKVVRSDIKWFTYEVWDDTADDFISAESPMEIILEFENNKTVQFAIVDYQLDSNEEPMDFTFENGAEILISFEKMVEIQNG